MAKEKQRSETVMYTNMGPKSCSDIPFHAFSLNLLKRLKRQVKIENAITYVCYIVTILFINIMVIQSKEKWSVKIVSNFFSVVFLLASIWCSPWLAAVTEKRFIFIHIRVTIAWWWEGYERRHAIQRRRTRSRRRLEKIIVL